MSHDHIHPEPTTFLSKYVFTVDHKIIARQFLAFALFWLAIGGTQAMMIRWTLANPPELVEVKTDGVVTRELQGKPFPVLGKLFFPETNGLITPSSYSMLFTMHGTIMIFFAITPLLIGCFGNLLIPLMIGARDMIFPTLNMLSFWTMFVAGIFMMASFFVPMGAAAGGWTVYPTLSTNIGQPGLGQTFWCLSLYFAGTSSIMGAVNYITTVIRLRAPGMRYFNIPMTVWGLWFTSILNAIFVPVIAAAALLLVMDRHFGTQFFLAGATVPEGAGDPVLFQHLFWIFGHPEVYILILPAWGIVSDLLSFFARRPAFGARSTILCMATISILSVIVYGHHMVTTGMTPILTETFMLLTMLISIPSAIFFLNWLATLYRGSIRFATPMLWALGVVIVFGLGGLTGLYHAGTSSNIYLHDSYFVVGHFHLTMAASVLFGGFAAIVFWFPKMFGRMMNEKLGKLHFAITLPCVVFIFVAMLFIGNSGMHRRIYNPREYEFLHRLIPVTKAITHTALLLGAAQFIFVLNFFYSLFFGKKASDNPWECTTLEWTVSSPPPYYNFKEIPTVYHAPYEYGRPDIKDKDWLGQDEMHPAASSKKKAKGKGKA